MEKNYKGMSRKERVMEIIDKYPYTQSFVQLSGYMKDKEIPDYELRNLVLFGNALKEKGCIESDSAGEMLADGFVKTVIKNVHLDERETEILSELDEIPNSDITENLAVIFDLVQLMYPGLEKEVGIPLIRAAGKAKTETIYNRINKIAENNNLEDNGESIKIFVEYARQMKLMVMIGVNEKGVIKWPTPGFLSVYNETYHAISLLEAVEAVFGEELSFNDEEKKVEAKYLALISPDVTKSRTMPSMLISRVEDGRLYPVTTEELRQKGVKLPYGLGYSE